MSIDMNVPFLDLISPHVEMEQELTEVFRKALHTAGFIGGPMLEEFEKAFAAFCDARYAVGVSSGTDALRFALMACGVKAGDVVVTVPNTFIATTEAISQAGALPEFVDIDEQTYNMDASKLKVYLEQACERDHVGRPISRRSRRPVTAVIPVHLYGQMADMDPILELADRYNLVVIEDACQAHGAEYFSRREGRWMKAGSMGKAAAFSFYPGKNLGACGEAGAVTTNNEDISKIVKTLRDHGQTNKYYHDVEGYNGRLDALQAGLLNAKLKRLAMWNARRRDAAMRYRELFQESEAAVVLPFEPRNSKAVYHLYVVQVADRDRVRAEITQHNIGTGIHYPIPLHLQKAYTSMGLGRGSFPVAERAGEHIFSLPMYPDLSLTSQEHIVRVVNRVVTNRRTRRNGVKELRWR